MNETGTDLESELEKGNCIIEQPNETNLLSPFQTHYYQAIYDDQGKDADTEDKIPFNQVDFDSIKTFALFPLKGSPIQTAFVIPYVKGFRLIYRKEGVYAFGASSEKPGHLVAAQKMYSYIFGLVEDDGSDYLKLVEKGEIGSLKKVNFVGGFRVIFAPALIYAPPNPDGSKPKILDIVGSVEVAEQTRTIDGIDIDFKVLNLKYA